MVVNIHSLDGQLVGSHTGGRGSDGFLGLSVKCLWRLSLEGSAGDLLTLMLGDTIAFDHFHIDFYTQARARGHGEMTGFDGQALGYDVGFSCKRQLVAR